MNKTKPIGRNLVLYTLLIVFLAVLLVVITKTGEPSEGSTSFSTAPPEDNQPVLGSSDAPVTVYEFGDFKCPACKVWNDQVFPGLKKEYIDTGKVKLVFINVLFHGEESKLASLAAESVFAQNEDAYWDFHKAIYDAQPQSDHDSAWVTTELMVDLAQRTSSAINPEQLEQDIINQTVLPHIQEDEALVKQYKVEKTPTIMVEDIQMVDPFDYEEMASLIEKKLSGDKK